VLKKEITRRRWRRDWDDPLKMSVCFQRMPKSSSWMQMAWIAVGHDHLRDGRPVDHRPPPALVIEADLVQRQPLAGVEADP
jgi:hypothetical protein